MAVNRGGKRTGAGRPRGVTKPTVIKNRAIRFLETTLKNEEANDQARVMAACKLIDLNTAQG